MTVPLINIVNINYAKVKASYETFTEDKDTL